MAGIGAVQPEDEVPPMVSRARVISSQGLAEQRNLERGITPSTDQTLSNVSAPQRVQCARWLAGHPSRPARRRTCALGLALGDRQHGVLPPPAQAHFKVDPPDSLSVSLKS